MFITLEGNNALLAARVMDRLPEVFDDGVWRTVREPEAIASRKPVRFHATLSAMVERLTGLPSEWLPSIGVDEIDAARTLLNLVTLGDPQYVMDSLPATIPRTVRRNVALTTARATSEHRSCCNRLLMELA